MSEVPFGALALLLERADLAVAARLNRAVRDSALARGLTARAAHGLAGVEVMLMLGLGASGGYRAAARMLIAVGVVYVASEVMGTSWQRERPFAESDAIEALTPHTPQRSFPSRHVASGLAMAAIGHRAHPRLGAMMALTAWLLGLSRVAAGLHYPSDILAGALLGTAVGAVFTRANAPVRRRRG